jgi:hypothetical protein
MAVAQWGAEWPVSGRYQQDQVTVATSLPNIVPFVETARHLAVAMKSEVADPQDNSSSSSSSSSYRLTVNIGTVLAFARLIIEPILF